MNTRPRPAAPAARFALLPLVLAIVPACSTPETPYGLALLERSPAGSDLVAFIERATLESEIFRRGLLEKTPGGSSRARQIARSIAVFRRHVKSRLGEQRPDVDAFTQDEETLVGWISGRPEALSGQRVYGPFEGKWYGLWTDFEVDHHWGEVTTAPRVVTVPADHGGGAVRVHSYQYAWVGDGYGLNLVASDAETGRYFLLGSVVHVEDGDLSRERARRPHVGIPAGAGKIIWITAREVFLEERLPASSGNEGYAITGYRYRPEGERLRLHEGFQALYTRRPVNRVPWYGFSLDLLVRDRVPVSRRRDRRGFAAAAPAWR